MAIKQGISRVLIVAVLISGMSTLAKTDPIGPDCSTCQGSIYELLNLGSFAPGTTDIRFRIDTSGYTGLGTFIDSAAIKVLSSMTGTSLVSAPGGIANWTIVGGALNEGGCLDNPGDAFACAQDVLATGGFAAVGGTFEWVFRVPSLSGFLDPASIKARYVDDNGLKQGDLLSEEIQLQRRVPEPTSLLLLGFGLVGLAAFRRRTKLTRKG